MRYGKIVTATLCFASSVGGMYFYPKSRDGPKNSSTKDLLTIEGFSIHKDIVKTLPGIRNFYVRDSDVFIITFPKSGTTWAQEIVYLIASDLNFDAAKAKNLDDRSPFLEFPCPGLKTIEEMASPRLIKTHLPLSLLPKQVLLKNAKMIYVSRNPRDVCVSFHHFCKKLSFLKYQGDFEDFFEDFVSGQVPYGPWWKHVLDYWKVRSKKNVLFITYEDLHIRNHECIRKISDFLGKKLTDEEVNRVSRFCDFEKMAQNNRANYKWLVDMGLASSNVPFMRKGRIGDWKNYFTLEMCEKMDEMQRKVFDSENSLNIIVETEK